MTIYHILALYFGLVWFVLSSTALYFIYEHGLETMVEDLTHGTEYAGYSTTKVCFMLFISVLISPFTVPLILVKKFFTS